MKTYLFFDHEWRYRHCELFDNSSFKQHTSGEASMQEVIDAYSRPEMKSASTDQFLEWEKEHTATIKEKTRFFLNLVKDSLTPEEFSEWENKVLSKQIVPSKLMGDGFGNYLAAIDVPDKIWREFESNVQALNNLDWSRPRELGTDLEEFAKENEPTYQKQYSKFRTKLSPRRK